MQPPSFGDMRTASSIQRTQQTDAAQMDEEDDEERNCEIFDRVFVAEREGRLPFASSDEDTAFEDLGSSSAAGRARESDTAVGALLARWQYSPTRAAIFEMLTDPGSSTAAWAVSVVVLLFIIVSSITFCLETIPGMASRNRGDIFSIVEIASVTLFTVEYGLKILTADRTWAFVWNFFNLVDLAAILPFYVELLLNLSGGLGKTRILRVIRLVRVFRVLKLGSKIDRMQVVFQAVVDSLDILGMLLFLLLLTLVFFSSLMYFAEKVRSRRGGTGNPPLQN
eukprot:evm.model.scf_909.1 EVM.evm.TU.scf_909.1   scf_909:392-7133(-)